MSLLPKFVRRLDQTATRTVLVSITLFGLVIAIFLIGKSGMVGDLDDMQSAIAQVSEGPWGLPALIALFIVCAFIGMPQFVLIGMAVVTFGPVQGALYAWIATLFSGTVTFWIGRLAGEKAIRRYGGNFANRMSSFIGRNAFLASAIVRNVPTGPFLLVNMAFGVSEARFGHYLAGMAAGVLPKLVLVTFAGQSALSAMGGQPLFAVGAAVGAIGLWIVLALLARRRVKADQKDLPESEGLEH